MDLFSIQGFIKYLLFAGHKFGHGIHSPFVFNIVSGTFRNKINPDIVLIIEKIRKDLLDNHNIIDVDDFGAGSKRNKSSLRTVSDIAKYSSVSRKYGILLSNMSASFGRTLIIELGTSLGISTMYMAASCPAATVITLEGSDALSGIAVANFKKAGLTNIKLRTGSFEDLLPQIAEREESPGLVFIDGDHRKEALLRYFDSISEMSDKSSVVIIDDIYYSREMTEAWDYIKHHRTVTLSIDIYRMGMLFFKEGMNQVNYVIRY